MIDFFFFLKKKLTKKILVYFFFFSFFSSFYSFFLFLFFFFKYFFLIFKNPALFLGLRPKVRGRTRADPLRIKWRVESCGIRVAGVG